MEFNIYISIILIAIVGYIITLLFIGVIKWFLRRSKTLVIGTVKTGRDISTHITQITVLVSMGILISFSLGLLD